MPLPDSGSIPAAVEHSPRLTIGTTTSDGIYFGTDVLNDRNDQAIGRFHFFADTQDVNIVPREQWIMQNWFGPFSSRQYIDSVHAPSGWIITRYEQRELLRFDASAEEVARRGSVLGHECCTYGARRYVTQLYEGLKDGSAIGKWFIRTLGILCGRESDGQADVPGRKHWHHQRVNLYDVREKGDFKGTFTCGMRGNLHWSCSEEDRNSRGLEMNRKRWAVNFCSDDAKRHFYNPHSVPIMENYENDRAACRLVRLVPAP